MQVWFRGCAYAVLVSVLGFHYLVVFATASLAVETVHLIPPTQGPSTIFPLDSGGERLTLEMTDSASGGKIWRAKLKGRPSDSVDTLLLNGSAIWRRSAGKTEFSNGLTITSVLSSLEFKAIDGFGKLTQENWRVKAPGFNAASNRLPPEQMGLKERRWQMTFGSSYSKLNFKQGSVYDESTTALTVSGGVRYRIVPKKWEMGLSSFANAVSLKKSATNTQIQYLGTNARIGRLIGLGSSERWLLSINFGAYFLSMTSKPLIGFRNVMGPEVYPTLAWRKSDGFYIGSYFKFSPVSSGGTNFTDFKNNETAAGATMKWRVGRGNTFLGPTLDWSKLQLKIDGGENDITTTSLSYGLGVEAGF